jgi:tetratricopeptide (TPR) repeat protein
VEIEPDNAFLRAHLARFLANYEFEFPGAPGRRDEIRALADGAIDADPGLVPAWLARARLRLIEGDAPGALEAARRARALEPADPEAGLVLGDVLIAAGSVDAGLGELRRAVEAGGRGHIVARARLARQLFDQGRIDEAAVEYARVLEYAPDSPSALNNLGAIALGRGNYVEAVKHLRRLLELKPDEYAASNLGMAYFHLDRMEEAIDAFSRAVRLAPDQPVLEQNLAEAYEKAGDAAGASRWFTEALADYDRDLAQVGDAMKAGLLAERAFCAAKLGRREEALENVALAIERAPADMFGLRSAARVHALVGGRAQAYDFLRRAVAAGYPAEELRHDPAFDRFRDDPGFLSLLIGTGD